jgi:hypothetical protein
MTQPAPPCQSGILNGGEDIKMIRQPSYLLNTTTVDFFLLQRGEVRAGRPLTVPGWQNDELRQKSVAMGKLL